MKQKYLLSKDPEKQNLTISEYAELEKGEFAFVCEEVHEIDDCRRAMEIGIESLVAVVRRPNMYPRLDFGEKIAHSIVGLLSDDTGKATIEIMIDDREDFIEAKDDIDPRLVYEEGAGGVVADAKGTEAKKDDGSSQKK